jgi:hypothetical protein
MTESPAIDLSEITLRHGEHTSREEGMCLLEAAAYLAGEKHTDHPQCVCPVLAAFGRSWNDGLESDAERDRLLKPLLPKLINTRGSAALAERRSWMALDWLIRVQAPAWMDLTEALREHAAILRALPPQTSSEEATKSAAARAAAGAAARAAAGAAAGAAAWAAAGAAARAAAGDVAWAAARAAAGDAARAAARAAAGDAAWAAAGAAARAAAGDAAWAAAGDALAPTKETLKQSALELFESMIALKDPA